MDVEKHKGIAKIKLNPANIEYFRERKARLKELFKMDFDIKSDDNITRDDYQIIFE
jgi:flagellar biosynthesis/type III secretory pathway protein FliH